MIPIKTSSFGAFDLLPVEVCVIDPHGRIIFVNAAWQRFAHDNSYVGIDFIGMNYLEICGAAAGVEQEPARQLANKLRVLLSGDGEHQFSFTYPCHAPDRKRWFKMDARAIPEEGAVLIHTDVSDAAVQAAPAAVLIEHSKLIHDMRTPLNAVIGFAELTRDHLAKLPNPSRECCDEYMDQIAQAGNRLLHIVNNILDYAQEVQGQTTTQDSPLNLAWMAQAVVRQLASLAQQGQIHCEVKENGDTGRLKGDETGLWKTLTNLIGNAIKYNRRGGTVRVTIGRNDSGGIELAVADNGVGIGQADLARIFEPFYRVRGPAHNKEGSGIGLATVREIVRRHDGVIRAASEPGSGTTIIIAFPSWRTQR